VAATVTSAATKDEGMMTAAREDMAASVVRKEADMAETNVVKRVVDMAEVNAVKNPVDMAEERGAKNTASVVTKVAVDMAEANAVKRAEAMVEASVVKTTVSAVKKAVDMEEATAETTTAPAADTQGATTRGATSRPDTATAQVVEALRAMAETEMKIRDVPKLSVTTVSQVGVREDMVETTPTTVPQGTLVAQLMVAATQAMEAANSPLAHPTEAVTAVPTTSPALLNTHNPAVVAQAMPTSSAWPLVC
jgi:hypothetical protein